MERERFGAYKPETSELLIKMALSWFLKDWKFEKYQYLDLGLRAGSATPGLLARAGVGLANITASSGRAFVKEIVS